MYSLFYCNHPKNRLRCVCLLIFSLSIYLSCLANDTNLIAPAPPKILVSIKPLQLIVHAITWGIVDTVLLFPPKSSPHSYQLKPSDKNKITNTDVIFWIGPNMESSIIKSLLSQTHAIQEAMIYLPSIQLIKNKHQCSHMPRHNTLTDKKGKIEEYDPHIWLNPNYAILIAQKVEQTLASLDSDPTRKKQYLLNLKTFEKNVKTAHTQNQLKLKPITNKPLLVFHDAYRYFKHSYNLNICDYFVLTPEQQPGIKHLINIQNKIDQHNIQCIFREPGFQPAFLNRIAANSKIKIAELDPLGINIAPDKNGYINLLNNMIDTICRCLSQ